MKKELYPFYETVPLQTITSLFTKCKIEGYSSFECRICGALLFNCKHAYTSVILHIHHIDGNSITAYVKANGIMVSANDNDVAGMQYIRKCTEFKLPAISDVVIDVSDTVRDIDYSFKRAFENDSDIVKLTKLACCVLGAKCIARYAKISDDVFENYVYPDVLAMADGMFDF